MNPFDLPGPDFLALFACLCVAAFAVGYVVRRIIRGPASPPGQPPDLSPAEIGYLSGGPTLAVNVALTRLVEGGAVTFDQNAKTLEKRGDGVQTTNDLERAILASPDSWFTVKNAVAAAIPALSAIRQRLEGLGLVLSQTRATIARFAIPAALLAVVFFGTVKVFVGIQRDKPVILLILACVLLSGVAWIASQFGAFLTVRGEKVLAALRGRHAALRVAAQKAPDSVQGHELALAVGLFGVALLAAGTYAGLHQTLSAAVLADRAIATTGGGWWSSCSSGWSSCGSSDSGCGGGGGGGCGGGGGGCGGCGGGGGD